MPTARDKPSITDGGIYIHDQNFDSEGFMQDIRAAKDIVGPAGEADAAQLHALVAFAEVLAYAGHGILFLSAFRIGGWSIALALGTLAACMISFARCMRWTIIGHHVSHGGYNTLVPSKLPMTYRRGLFAVGFIRRVKDWLDWMLPEAWDLEHNKLHHYALSEDSDPDLVERNFKMLRDAPLPVALKLVFMVFPMSTWKWSYYSPNTLKELLMARHDSYVARHWPKRVPSQAPLTIGDLFLHGLEALLTARLMECTVWMIFWKEWLLLIAPMVLLVMFPPLTIMVLSSTLLWKCLCPSDLSMADVAFRAFAVELTAEVFTNLHSFIIIVCNHCGADLYHYNTPCRAYSAEFFLRCAYSSANFETGSNWFDIPYGWLNYQVEHHMFPDMTPLQYRKLQPLVKSICNKYGVVYTQQNALWRTWAMLRVAVGLDCMKSVTACLPQKRNCAEGDVPDAAKGS